jgi:heme-degrading monooxygenase HmoA
MFARMTTLFIKSDKIDEGISIYESSVMPAAREQKGFRMAKLLLDRNSGRAISITFWETEEDAAANEENLYYQNQLVKFMSLYSAQPVREGYEVAVESG